LGVSIVSAPNAEGTAATPNGTEATPANGAGNAASPLVKPVGPDNTALPAVEKPAEAPMPVNDIKQGTGQQQPVATANKPKKTKPNLDEESSSKKKKKKGLGKLNPF
jgi:outer membrane protein assembly factor BamD